MNKVNISLSFNVRKRPCRTCGYRKNSGLDVEKMESTFKKEGNDFVEWLKCHTELDQGKGGICCRGFWNKNKHNFPLGKIVMELRRLTKNKGGLK